MLVLRVRTRRSRVRVTDPAAAKRASGDPCRWASGARTRPDLERMYTRFGPCRPLSVSFCSKVANGCLTHIASTHAASSALTANLVAGMGAILLSVATPLTFRNN
jgi:hypothetical protein